MTWTWTWYAVGTLAAAVASVAFAWVAARQPKRAGSVPLTLLLLGAAEWAAAVGVAAGSESIETKLLFQQIAFVGQAAVPVAWLIFVLSYTGIRDRVRMRLLTVLTAIPVATVVLAWTNEVHRLVWTGTTTAQVGNTAFVQFDFGPWYWIFLAYSYLLIFAGLALLARVYVSSPARYRRQIASLVLGVSIPFVVHVALISTNPGAAADPTPFTFVASGVVFTVAVSRQELLPTVPLAREVARNEVFKTTDDGVLVVDRHGFVVDLNARASEITGVDSREGLGTPLDALDEELASLLERDQESDALKDLMRLIDGERRYFDVQIAPLTRGERRVGTLLSLRDVTERRRREQRLDVFNRTLRHDLRNAMTVVIGRADLVAEGERPAEQATAIREQAREIVALGDQIRAVENALAERQLVVVDVASLLRSVATSIGETYPPATVAIDLPKAAWARVNPKIYLALENVVENAVVHSDREHPSVEVTARIEDKRVVITVADDGPGLPQDEQAVLARGRETPLAHTSGLGLWIVYWLVADSGGDVTIGENDPRGSVVTITLPATQPEDGGPGSGG